MFMTIALLCLVFLLLAILLLRPSPAVVIPPRRVSFSPVTSDSPSRPWSSPFHKPKFSGSPRAPQPDILASVDQFGRILASSSASDVMPKPPRRLSTPLRLSFTSKRRSSTASCTSTVIQIDQVDTGTPLPQSSTSATQSPLQRTRFVNPFSKHSRSRTLSPPTTSKSPDTPPSILSSISSPSPPASPPERRRTLVNKFKSIFKSIPPEPSPVIRSKPIPITNTRLRRKPVARTQPYGPPWNAPMPVPDFPLPQHSLQKPAQTMSPSPWISQKHSVHQRSPAEIPSISPGQLSPRAFVNKLDEKLSLLQQQHNQDSIPSPHG